MAERPKINPALADFTEAVRQDKLIYEGIASSSFYYFRREPSTLTYAVIPGLGRMEGSWETVHLRTMMNLYGRNMMGAINDFKDSHQALKRQV